MPFFSSEKDCVTWSSLCMVCACAHVHVCIWGEGDRRKTRPQPCHPLPLRQCLSLNLELTDLARLAGPQGILLTLPPWCWSYKGSATTMPGNLRWKLWIELRPSRASILLTTPLHQPSAVFTEVLNRSEAEHNCQVETLSQGHCPTSGVPFACDKHFR